MRRAIRLLLISAVLAAPVLAVGGCEPAPLYKGNLAGPKVALLGDSILCRSTACLHAHLDPWWAVGITSRSGYRIDQVQADADRYAAADGGPAAVVIELGTNDAMQGWPQSESEAALRTMLASLPSASCAVVVDVNANTLAPALNAWARTWNSTVLPAVAAADGRVRLVGWSAYVASRYAAGSPEGQLTTDMVHPTALGQEALATLIDDALARCDVAPPEVAQGLPVAPSFLTATSADGAATLAWTAGPDRGSDLTGTVVVPSAGEVPGPEQWFASTAGPVRVTGLENGVTYTFTVAAISERGRGEPSAPSPPVTVGVPAAPLRPAALPGDGAAVVGWTPGADNGAAITGYEITPFAAGVPEPVQQVGPSPSWAEVNGLVNGTSYTFGVAAVNERGTGPMAVTTETVTVGSPGPPADPVATPGDGSVTLAWTPGPDNGAAITGYEVQPYVGYLPQPVQTFASADPAQLVTGLVNGKAYAFRVAAVNERGRGAWSTLTPTVVPSAVP